MQIHKYHSSNGDAIAIPSRDFCNKKLSDEYKNTSLSKKIMVGLL
jgi:hypothetical protein